MFPDRDFTMAPDSISHDAPRRILYIDHYAGSTEHGMEYRPFYLAREWTKLGHRVEIVAASFAHCRSRQPAATKSVQTELVDGIRYWWLPTPAYAGNGLGRVRNMLAFIGQLYRRFGQICSELRPDVVIASSTYPADIFPAARVARRWQSQLIFELHDLWPLSPMQLGGMSRWHPFIVAMQIAEDFACRNSDAVVSILPAARTYLQARGLHPDKFFHVPNGIVLDEWAGEHRTALVGPLQQAFEAARAQDHLVLLYAGAHGPANDLDTILEAAHRLRDAPVEFFLVGHGPEKERLRDRAAECQLSRVKFFDPVPKSAVPNVLEAADALLFTLAPSPLFQYGVSPNKLIDYMMAGRPILCSLTAANDPVAEHACGFSVPAGQADGLAQQVRHLLALNEQERSAMGARGREVARSTYDYRALARRFAAVFAASPSHSSAGATERVERSQSYR
jgi:glycosyltransferase involved in cell wall biosynthesis